MSSSAAASTIAEVTHHRAEINDEEMHYVTAGDRGSPILLVHGFPESWWAFRGVIPILAAGHRVIAVDLPGFGDSAHGSTEYSSTFTAESLRQLLVHLDLGPVHLTGQDIGGVATFRLAASSAPLIRSYAAIETGLPGFGLEGLADVTHGGTWHIGVLAAPGIPQMLLAGRERDFLSGYALPSMTGAGAAITETDIAELTRVYAQPDGFAGAGGLYRSMLAEGQEIRRIVADGPLTLPVLSVAAGTGPMTHQTMHAVASDVTEANLTGIGHLAALEDPAGLARILLDFYGTLDGSVPARA